MNVSASVSPGGDVPAGERLHVAAAYDRYDWRARAALNGADFYDLFGPTKVGRKGYHALVGHKSLLVFDEPRRLELDLNGSVDGNLDRLPEYQNIAIDVDRLYSFESRLSFSDIRNSLGFVDDETGTRWSAGVQSRVVGGVVVPRVSATYDRGLALPIGHSSVWLRSAGGFSPRDRDEPFANFFFGGFGNNYVDHADEKRYRQDYAFPGIDLNAIGGRNFLKSTVEWNLPPWRFSRLGTPGLYASWLRPALFGSALVTNLDAQSVRRAATNMGGQLDLRLIALSELEMTLSIGGAVAFERDRPAGREAMISLKILK
jgi:hypothetical protein